MKIEIVIDNLTKAQLLALYQYFKNWKRLCNIGSSKNMSFFVDGDGNLHPDIHMKLPGYITVDEILLAKECYGGKSEIDFDKIAKELRYISDAKDPETTQLNHDTIQQKRKR